jgi:hypothetical protein
MDQAAFAHSPFFRHIRECSEDANLDGGLLLCAGGDYQKGTGARYVALHFPTDFIRPSFEKIQLFRAFQDVDDDNDDASPYNQLNLFDT